jgi:phage-related protein
VADRRDKELGFVGSSKDDLSAFPKEAKSIAGHQLRLVQQGHDPDHWRPMPGVGLGVSEIIVETGDAYRVFYVAKFDQAVYVLHAFQKTTQQTAQKDLDKGKKRYRELVRFLATERAEARKQKRGTSK